MTLILASGLKKCNIKISNYVLPFQRYVHIFSDYVDRLMSATLCTAQTKLAERAIEMGPGHETPPPLCSQYDRPIKEAAIQEKRSRYQ